jgi:hypothetical protein
MPSKSRTVGDMNRARSARTSGRLELRLSGFRTIFTAKSVTLVSIALIIVLLGLVAEAQDRAAPNGIHAGMFPNAATDLPAGWWWAKTGYDYHLPKNFTESMTPMWMQNIAISRASGYVFKPYSSGGSWCRPEGGRGSCNVPHISVDIGIVDWGAVDGTKGCLRAHKLTFSELATQKTKISENSYYVTRNDPPQYILYSCFGRYRTYINVVGENGEAPNLNVARYYDSLIARRIGGTSDPESKSKEQGISGVDTVLPVMPPTDTSEPRGNEPISPETVLVAVAGGSLVMTLGGLLQLWGMGGLQNLTGIRGVIESLLGSSETEATDTEPGLWESETVQEVEVIPKEPEALVPESGISEPVIPDSVPSGFEYQGKVWYQPPWDKDGPYFMSKDDYNSMRSMMRQGKEWSDRWGWVDPGEGKAMETQRTEAWDKYKSDTDQDIKAITDQIHESQQKLAEIRDKQAELEKIEQLRERQAELEKQRELDNSFATQLRETMKNYVDGVNRDLDALPGDLERLALDAAREIRDITGAIITAAGDTAGDLTNGDNWKAVGQAAVDTAKELILHPVDSSVKVGDTVKSAGKAGIRAAGVAGNVVLWKPWSELTT